MKHVFLQYEVWAPGWIVLDDYQRLLTAEYNRPKQIFPGLPKGMLGNVDQSDKIEKEMHLSENHSRI